MSFVRTGNQSFQSVSSVSDWYQWSQTSLLDALYWDTLYNDLPTTHDRVSRKPQKLRNETFNWSTIKSIFCLLFIGKQRNEVVVFFLIAKKEIKFLYSFKWVNKEIKFVSTLANKGPNSLM